MIARAADAARLDAAKHRVQVQLATEGPIPFSLDAELMERVFWNLIQNAVQASPEGSLVTVGARVNGTEAVAEVKDQGRGIPPDNMESIFNPFFTTKSEGTGLGLAIVAKIVDEHGGKVHVQSKPGEGTTFTVTLPMSDHA